MAKSIQMNFKKEVPVLSKEAQTLSCYINGTIKQVTVCCPHGPYYLVELRVLHGKEAIFPTGGGQALFDNTTIAFPMSQSIKVNDTISVEWTNHDRRWPHTIPVIVSIVED